MVGMTIDLWDDPAPTLQAPPTFSAFKMAGGFAGECLPFVLCVYLWWSGGEGVGPSPPERNFQ